jgi:hypothetical protein
MKAVLLVLLGFSGRTVTADGGTQNQTRKPEQLVTLTVDDARLIAANQQGFKDLSYLETLPLDVARVLVASKGGINLSGLRELPLELASVLAGHENEDVYLDGLQSISAESLRAIAGGRLHSVSLEGVRQMPENVFAALLDTKTPVICGFEELPPTATALLAKKCPPSVWWHRLSEISDAQLEAIVDSASTISLGLKRLTPKQAELLARCKTRLVLDSVTTIDANTARLLTRRKSEPQIELGGLESLDEETRAYLKGHGKVSFDVKSRSGQPPLTHRVEDIAALIGAARRSAIQAHAVSQVLGRAAMGALDQETVVPLASKVMAGLERVDIVMLNKFAASADHDKTVKEAVTATGALQRHVMAELQAAKALAESRASDESRREFTALAVGYDGVESKCREAQNKVDWWARKAASPKQGRSQDINGVLVFAFQETHNTHFLAESMLQSLKSLAREQVSPLCEVTIVDWLANPIDGPMSNLHKYLGSVEHSLQHRELFDALAQLQVCVLAELQAVRECAKATRIDRVVLTQFDNANKQYDAAVRPLAKSIQRHLQSESTEAGGQSGGEFSPNGRVLSDNEWASVVAVFRKQGIVKSADEARAYFETFALLKGVFVEKGITEPTTKQLFGLAKTLSVAFGKMPPEKIETTLRTMLHLAKEAQMELATREELNSMGD